jgi:hypothetical protein
LNQGLYLRWVDVGGVGGDDDADDGQRCPAVRAAVRSGGVGDAVRERGRDGGDGWDGVVVSVSLAPGGFAAAVVAVPLA